MRILMLTLLTAVLAWGVATFLSTPADEAPTPEPEPIVEPVVRTPEDQRAADRRKLSTGTLVVTVRDAKGRVPPGARAGYRHGSENRVRAVNSKGQARFTDAPLGTLTIVASAPGFREDRQQRPLLAGVRADVTFVLKPE